MSSLIPKGQFSQFLYDLDARVNSGVYTAYENVCRFLSAYSAFLGRFRVRGLKRVIIDLVSDGATIGLGVALGLIYFALPPIWEDENIWDRGREYSVTFTDAEGAIIGRRGIWQDDAIPLDEIPPHMIAAVLATEDARFFEHFGVDFQGTARAMVENLRASGVVQGGSTITQQLAKNLFLSPERTLQRKMYEAFLSLWIEARLTKEQILKLYLDRSYLGGGTYGLEAAAQFYFGKSIRDVNLSEAAVLAGLFKAPSSYAPHVNPEASRLRTNVVLYRMLDVGAISQGQLFAARREPAQIVDVSGVYSPNYFLDWAYDQTLQTLREQRLENEYVIEVKTTVDLEMQQFAQETVNAMLDENAEAYRAHQASLVSMEPDGAVRVIVGGRDYEASQFNRATEALRQPGSSFKPFVYLTALASGLRPDSIVVDQPVTIGNWSPRNYSGGYRGRMTLATALMKSVNTVAVQLGQRVGIQRIIEVAHQVGLRAELRGNASMPLGTNEVTVLDLTGAYATFANGGVSATPYAVLEISRPNGEVLYNRARNGPQPRQVVAPGLIADLNYMLNQVVLNGTGRRAQLGFTPQCGKTGTTSSYRDAWFMGYTAHLVTGVWFGNDDYTPTRRVTGGSLPAITWQRFMAKALESKVAEPLLGVPLEGRYAAYVDPDLSGVEVQFEDLPEGAYLVYDDNGNLISIEDPSNSGNGDSDTVSRAFENMFSLFRNSRNSRPSDNGTSRYTSDQPSGGYTNSNRAGRNNRAPAIESLR